MPSPSQQLNEPTSHHATALIVAGGVGKRMGSETPKQFLPLLGRPLLWHSLSAFDAHPEVTGLCVAVDARWHEMLRTEEPWTQLSKPVLLAPPGQERADSVRNGLEAIREAASTALQRGIEHFVLIHDAARPLVTARMISETLALARRHGGAIVARPVRETVKRTDSSDVIQSTVERRGLWIAETPQTFAFDLIWRAHQEAHSLGLHLTDDAQAVEHLGEIVRISPAESPNPKVTVPEDLVYVEWLMTQQLRGERS
jgi:2-C-methyl-D-erythritol 4-phosphate cytidylyltransferase